MLQSTRFHTQKPYLLYPKDMLGSLSSMSAKILVVEDEPAINELIANTLELSDFSVVQAFDTQGAYIAVVDEAPDLILLDWMMPHDESGIDFARRLKKKPNHCQHSHHHAHRQR